MIRVQTLKVIGLLVAGFALAACQGQAATNTGTAQTGSAPRAIPTALPTRAVTASSTVATDGSLMLATPLVSTAFEATGKVTNVNVVPGQSVKKGDVLAEIDPADLNTALQQAQEALALQQAQIDKSLAPAKQTDLDTAKAALNAAYASYNDVKNGNTTHTVEQALRSWNEAKNSLYAAQVSRDTTCGIAGVTDQAAIKQAKTGTDCKAADLNVQSAEMREQQAHQAYLDAQKPASQDELTKAWANVVQAQTSLANLQNGASEAQKKVYDLQIEQAQLTVARAQRDLTKVKLVSPCDCVVQTVTLNAGASSSGGSVTLLDTSQLVLQTTNLNEQDVVKVQAGQAASIRLKAFSQSFTGKVSAILPVSSGTSGSVSLYTVLINLDPTDAALRPGMTGQAEISLQ